MEKNKDYQLSVKIIILDSKGRCLLLKRSEASKSNAGKWDFAGGKMEPCENFQDALIREVLEETGLTISIVRLAGAAESENEQYRIAYLFFEGRAEPGEVRLSNEHSDYIWVERNKLPELDICPQFLPFVANWK